MLCISEKDIIKSISYKETIDAVESAMILYEKRDFLMPDRMHLDYKGNTLLLMPCFIKEKFSTKLVSVFPENQQKNKPVIYGTVILNDGSTGEPLAVINGGKLTAMRTAAFGGLGVRYLSKKNATSLGIVGAGMQGFHLALFACAERPIAKILVLDTESSKISVFIQQLKEQLPEVKIQQAKSPEELTEQSDIIITATTSTKPVLPDNPTLLKEKTFIGVGSYKPNMQEFPKALFSLINQCFVDTEHAMAESGDLLIPIQNNHITKDQIYNIGKLITGKVKLAENNTRLLKSVGMALFDLVVGNLVYENAIQKNIGTNIEL